ncbi:MAG: hypothetical protein DUD39_15495 [Coriobacteriaceae bacterium]|nr:MAG: hypothetical protein DUD39_15495 [Coriobacteriaceae bacterium]
MPQGQGRPPREVQGAAKSSGSRLPSRTRDAPGRTSCAPSWTPERGSWRPLREVLPGAAWQRCQAHFSYNVCKAAPKGVRAGLKGGSWSRGSTAKRTGGEAHT